MKINHSFQINSLLEIIPPEKTEGAIKNGHSRDTCIIVQCLTHLTIKTQDEDNQKQK
jgi:hypothetical protein